VDSRESRSRAERRPSKAKTFTKENEANKDWRFSLFSSLPSVQLPTGALGFGHEGILATAAEFA
jgi:hypothetical protein